MSLFSQHTGFSPKIIYGFILKQKRVHVFQTWKTEMTKCIMSQHDTEAGKD